MFLNIKSYPADSRIGRSQALDAAPFLLQILTLTLVKTASSFLKPQVYIIFIDLLIYETSLINKRNYRFIINCILDSILMDIVTAAETSDSGFLLFHQRSTCKAYVTSTRENYSHFSRKCSIVTAVTFIYKHKYIAVIYLDFLIFSSIEFIDYRCHNISFIALYLKSALLVNIQLLTIEDMLFTAYLCKTFKVDEFLSHLPENIIINI